MALNLTEDSLPLLLLWAHTDHTDPTGFARLALNLTDASLSLMDLGSHGFYFWAHTDPTHSFCFSGWEISQMLSAGLLQRLTQIQQIQQSQLLLRNLFNPLNLCEIYFNNSVCGICVRRGEGIRRGGRRRG